MCEFTTALAIASVAATAATTISAASAQAHQAQDQARSNALNQQYIAQDLASKVMQAQGQEQLVNKEAYQKLDIQGQQARSASATATTAAGEAGVSGLSVDALQREYMARSGEYAAQVEDNRTASVDRLQLQMQGFDTQAQAADARLPTPNYPNFLDAALKIGGGALSAYNTYRDKTPSSLSPDLAIGGGPMSFPSKNNDPTGGY